MRWSVVWVLLSMACASGAHRAQPAEAYHPTPPADAHVVSAQGVAQGQTTDATVIERLRSLASTLPAGANAERAAIGDLAYPKDQAENEAMGGYGLLLVTGVSRHPDELPLGAVKVQSAAGELPLERVALRPGEVTDAEVVRAFGSHRIDELYYFPVALTRLPCKVLVDFAKNRQNFELLSFPPPPDADGFPRGLRVLDPSDPNTEAVHELAAREFGWREPE